MLGPDRVKNQNLLIVHFGMPGSIDTLELLGRTHEAARARLHKLIDTPHFLIAAAESKILRPVLTQLRVNPQSLVLHTGFVISRRHREVTDLPEELQLTSTSEVAMRIAALQAQNRGSERMDPQDILWGLSASDSTAIRILEISGVYPTSLMRVLSSSMA